VHAARVPIADVQNDQSTAVIVFGNIVNGGGTSEAMHDAEADGELVQHRLEHAADRSLLAPDFAPATARISPMLSVRPLWLLSVFEPKTEI
jgi:hypothetical protein